MYSTKLVFLLNNYANYQFYLFMLFLTVSFLISLILIIMPQMLSKNLVDSKLKLASYECGFEPFGDSRMVFDIQYYMLGILFILFDIEVFFIFAWTMMLKYLSYLSFVGLCLCWFFLTMLMLGFIFEWKAGLLDWF